MQRTPACPLITEEQLLCFTVDAWTTAVALAQQPRAPYPAASHSAVNEMVLQRLEPALPSPHELPPSLLLPAPRSQSRRTHH